MRLLARARAEAAPAELVVTVGGLAIRLVLGERSLDCIGRLVLELDDAVAIPLPHPSGTSRWLNDRRTRPGSRPRSTLVRAELDRL